MRVLCEIIRIGAFLILTFLCIDLHADQSKPASTSSVKQLIQKAEANQDSATYYLENAYQKAVNDQDKIRVNRLWAEHYLSLNQEESAIQRLMFNVSYRFPELDSETQLELARSYVLLDRISENDNNLETSIKHLRTAIPPLEQKMHQHIDLSWAYLRLGVRLWYNEQYSEAEKWWQKAYIHAKKYSHRNVEIKALHHQGFVYAKQRKLSLAKSHYKYVLSLLDQTSGSFYEDRILALNALGNAFNLNNDLDSALYYFKKGLLFLNKNSRQPSLKKSSRANQGLFNHNLGNVLRKKGEIAGAIEALKAAITANETFYGEHSTQLIRSLRDLGACYQISDKIKLAKNSLTRALEISKAHEYDKTKSYSRLGFFYQKAGAYKVSLQYFDSALISNGSFSVSNRDLYVHSTDLFVTLVGQSMALASDPNVSLEKLETSYKQFTETVRFAYGKTDSNAIYDLIPVVLENLYTGYSRIHERTKNLIWLNKLWEIMELNKAVKLRNQLNVENELKYAIPEQFLQMEKSLQDSISSLMSNRKSDRFDSTLFLLNRRYDEFLGTMEKDFPRYYSLKNNLDVTSLREVVQKLDHKTQLLNFFEGKEHIYVIRLSQKGVLKQKIPKSEINDWIQLHNEAVFNRSTQNILISSKKIRESLLLSPQNLDGIQHFHIIPDGIIWNLNFASISSDNDWDVKFMGNQYTFSYHYFANKELSKNNRQSGNVLAFSFSESTAPPKGSRSSDAQGTEAPIPGTSAEIRSISQIWEGKYYFAKNANETTFKAEGDQYSILHLAVHGFLNEASPENSYLKFATADSLNDGKLHVYEIYNLNLNADLGVLSACHSGQGKIVVGEGMMSLGRAFAYAGVRSLLISRWEVSDYSAPYLMKYFYEGLKEGMYKSEALKYAQTKYLKNHSDALTSSPFYWSSFYVLGDDDPIYKTAILSSWMVWLLAVLLLSTGIFYRRKMTRTTH